MVSGDNDFVGALQAIKDLGKNVEIALFGSGSQHLRDVADRVVRIDSAFLQGCWQK
ncbi:MAG: NYN domain-containing protein [Chloroflexi bacterium]|nr:NYN domain-containing protein [Chloroflexota bacterium]